MSDNTLGLLDNSSGMVDKSEGCRKETTIKDETMHTDNTKNDLKQTANSASEFSAALSSDASGSTEVKAVNPETEYIESENLTDVEDIDTSLSVCSISSY